MQYLPVLVRDIHPGSGSSTPNALSALGDWLLFGANDGIAGFEPWVSDGTAIGTGQVQDLAAGELGSLPFGFVGLGNRALFVATDAQHGRELWATDGAAAGTDLVADLVEGSGSSAPAQLTAGSSQVFFTTGAGAGGNELWATDGTAAGTGPVADINAGAAGSFPAQLVSSAGQLLFLADDGIHGAELWISGGTAATTALVADINPGSGSALVQSLTPRANADVFFSADDGRSGRELWTSDRTSTGTRLVKDINPTGSANPSHLVVIGDRVFFSADDGIHGTELWVSDGTTAGTQLLADIQPGPQGSNPLNLTRVGNTLYFTANDGELGRELWASDGADTRLVADLYPGAASAFPTELTRLNNQLFFSANDGTHGTELWRLDLSAPAADSPPLALNFQDFSDPSLLIVNGAAKPAGQRLRLTPDQRHQAGSAFYRNPFSLDADTAFETHFQFQIGSGAAGADGFVWLLQSSAAGPQALGGGGGQLGYGGIGQSLAIEFDTHAGKHNPGDGGSDNHVSVLLNGDPLAPLVTASPDFDLNGGTVAHAWVSYDGTSDLLEVFVAASPQKPGSALLSTTLDLDGLFDDSIYAGFTAGTGGRANRHDILSWQLTVGDAPIASGLPQPTPIASEFK